MAIHDLWSYDNAPVGTSLLSGTTDLTRVSTSSNPYAYYTGNPGMILTYSTGNNAAVSADGFLTMTRNGSGFDSPMYIGVNQVQNWSTSTKFWIGFRTKASYAVTAGSTGKLLSSITGFNGSVGTVFVNENDVVANANTEAYVEVFFDTVALTFSVYVNGTLVRSGTFTNATLSNAASMYFQFGTGSTAAPASSTRGYRDFYFLDIDATDTLRLGAIRSSRAGLSNVSGSEWSLNSSADLATALTTALQNPPVTTPSASSPSDNQPLTVTLGTALDASSNIIAVQPQITLIGDARVNYVDIALAQGGQNTDLGKQILPISASQFNQRWGVQRTAPDGNPWTVTKLNATQAILTPSGLPATLMLMHMNGANGSTSYVDATGRTWSNNGNGTIVTAQSKFGGAAYQPNSTGFISAPADPPLVMASGAACTIEMWVYRTSALGDTTILSCKTANDSTHQTSIGQQSSMGLGIYLTDGSGWRQLAPSSAFTLNQWNHVAVVYNNGVYTGYVNGVAQNTVTSALTFGLAGGTYTIGGNQYNSASQFPGYIDEVRISSVARYNANFTPPVAPFGTDGVSLASVFSSTQLTKTFSPSSATTTVALIASIMADAGVNLVPEDIVSSAVSAGATTVTLTVAAGSYNFQPGSTVTLTFAPTPKSIMLLHMDGANQSQTMTESIKGRVMTVSSGTAATNGLSTAQAKFGSASYLSNGSGGFVSPSTSDLQLGVSGDFTIEFYFYCISITAGGQVMYEKGNAGARIQYNAGKLYVYTDQSANTDGGQLLTVPASFIKAGQWQHLAVVKSSGVWTAYVDGQVGVTVSAPTQTFGNNADQLILGNYWNGQNPMNGYLDELRVSSVARYKSAFTPPVAVFAVSDGLPIANAFSTTQLRQLKSPTSATTTVALIPQLMLDALVNLVPEDIVSATVNPGATTVTLTVAAGSVNYQPGSTVTLTFSTRANTALLMHFDNTGSTTYTDDVGHTVTNTGAAVPGTPGQFGAGYFPSGAGYLSVTDANDLHLTGDCTIEMWLYHNNITQNGFPLSKGTSAQSGYQYVQSTSGLIRLLATDGSIIVGTPDASKTKVTTWQHVAFVRFGNVWSLYIDGALIASATSTQTFGNNAYPLFIGKFVNAGSDLLFSGRIDELRISTMARYTAAFTPPSAAFVQD
ncbi:hypothetical protein [Burkholderia phage FLC9]|nr:hypothetical protein [Burkholderia phage FLC9]